MPALAGFSLDVLFVHIMKRIAPTSLTFTDHVGAASTRTASDYVIATGATGVAAASAGAAINSAVLGSPLAFVYHSGVALVAGAYATATFFSGEAKASPTEKPSVSSTDAPAKAVTPISTDELNDRLAQLDADRALLNQQLVADTCSSDPAGA